MIISHRHKYIFVHIPKTGGTSLTLALEQKVGANDILIGDTPKAKRRRQRYRDVQSSGRLWKHSRLKDVYGMISQKVIEEYFVFTIVRNPWERLVSYYFWLRSQTFKNPSVSFAQNLSFVDFIANDLIQKSLRNSLSTAYVTDRNGKVKCDHFLRLESIDNDVKKLSINLGYKIPSLKHTNASTHEVYQRYYTNKAQEIVGKIMAEEIEKFGYHFDP